MNGKLGRGRQVGDDVAVERFTQATAEVTGVGERTIQREAARGEKLGEEVLRKVVGTSLDKGEELDALAKLSEKKRDELVDRAASGLTVTAKTAAKQEKRAKRESELGAKQMSAPEGQYGVIVEDFEWDHVVWSRETGMDRHAANHYPVSEDAHTAQEIVERTKDRFACAAPDCFLAMWSTVQHLAIAIDVLRLRGFKYVSHYVWGKDRIGLGHWNRNKHEIILLGVKGNIPCPAKGTQWDSLIMASVGEHSAKPDCFLEMIEAYFPTLPKIELNRRGPARPGWQAWGLEAVPEGSEPGEKPAGGAATTPPLRKSAPVTAAMEKAKAKARAKARAEAIADAMEADKDDAKSDAKENGERWSDMKEDWINEWIADNWDEASEAEFEADFNRQWERDHGQPENPPAGMNGSSAAPARETLIGEAAPIELPGSLRAMDPDCEPAATAGGGR
jgi:N6-adenosine-specific RNA methylase IME4